MEHMISDFQQEGPDSTAWDSTAWDSAAAPYETGLYAVESRTYVGPDSKAWDSKDVIMTDFERGLRNSISSAFPSATMDGCLFHFCQATLIGFGRMDYRRLT